LRLVGLVPVCRSRLFSYAESNVSNRACHHDGVADKGIWNQVDGKGHGKAEA
jgi:hypothetical protein